MKIGIVGAEGKKFTEQSEARARHAIRDILTNLNEGVTGVCSGECHLGGIDKWAHEIADELGITFQPFPPREHNWTNGYKPRNLQIAKWSDKVYNITVDTLPPDYRGMRFDVCYHCVKAGRGDGKDHIKSGGCWTAIQAIKMGKDAVWVTITNDT